MRSRFTIRAGLAAFLAAGATAAVLVASSSASNGNAYTVHNLVSDGAVPADHTAARLVNAWGLAAGPATPWWVADNGTNLSTLYNATGGAVALVVSVPG